MFWSRKVNSYNFLALEIIAQTTHLNMFAPSYSNFTSETVLFVEVHKHTWNLTGGSATSHLTACICGFSLKICDEYERPRSKWGQLRQSKITYSNSATSHVSLLRLFCIIVAEK